ncbi:hypothetical protein BDZ89DRAFT_426844 [Hymenopellis radicata]|nr:hypothetical protein BDZ89DRAFT_426844 [Hymenopellis radicata]
MTLSDAPQSALIDDMENSGQSAMEEDGQSLFGGSPPASPIMRGRSPSPALALPGTNSIANIMHSTQNVGTIALPGSQLDIELHVNPLALSLSSSLRPPAHNQAAAATSGPSSSSREATNKRKINKSLKRKASVLYERPPPPPIPLPGPSEPIPSNFLRNQSALLGTAGLVGNVNTSILSTPRGTCSNPIVIDDELPADERPAPKRRKLSNGAPTPSNSEIVRALLKDKDVLPLLHELLVLFARGAFAKQPPAPKELERKKVKFGSIPAGAGDWNVDFGRENDMPRCKYLLSQLMTHIRSATRKAAIKNYWFRMNGKDGAASTDSDSTDAPKVFGHYRPATLHYPSNPGPILRRNHLLQRTHIAHHHPPTLHIPPRLQASSILRLQPRLIYWLMLAMNPWPSVPNSHHIMIHRNPPCRRFRPLARFPRLRFHLPRTQPPDPGQCA